MIQGFRYVLAVGVLLLGFVIAPCTYAEEYKIDNTHSTLGFSVVHLMVSKVTGQFDDYQGTINFDPNDLTTSKIDVTVKAASVNTHVEKRDEHLKGADFFDTAKFEQITFVSTEIVKDGDQYKVTGDLTIKGVTKSVSFPVSIAGPVNSPMGGTAIGLEASFKINRQDYGVSWNKSLDNGGFMVSDEVTVNIGIEAHK